MLYIVIAIAGAAGSLLRYACGLLIPTSYVHGFPLGTLTVNLIGCFALSWFLSSGAILRTFPDWVRTAITTGLLGSFTTFSTYNVELIQLVEQRQFVFASSYVLLSIAGGYLFSRWGVRS